MVGQRSRNNRARGERTRLSQAPARPESLIGGAASSVKATPILQLQSSVSIPLQKVILLHKVRRQTHVECYLGREFDGAERLVM